MEKHLPTTRTARYQQLGEPTAATRHLWLVLHGYGQLAEYFIRHFAPLHAADPTGTVVVAPEALSRFYLQDNGGRVGASWMTRADRLAEIADQHTYLTALLHSLQAAAPRAAVTVLGFSQGTATASRWLAHLAATESWRPSRLVLWAGDFPADALPAALLLPSLPVELICGDQDEYIGPEKLQQQAAALRAHGAQVSTHTFAGGHALHSTVLQQLWRLGHP
ncbi:MAG: alpha/beta hydrolase [Janthinobacterium lividum]